ncbi:o-succinylbenzoate synthase [Leptolyngbya sp. BL0902]|uniref:o-succinylbenzoate synthase n=1 Tax=Leptolyngbya sp. BL0902 TaxID=1115757 RepID=UPI0018E6E6CF|nr:o-succinylbenzoate synthase [Leptolyngbya sp. BL0902]QQE63609.1 o-succinylbenzoate synthase [Leptolyngbya sp. BL0902]
MRLEIRPYQRPFRKPLQTAHGLWSLREGVLLRLTDDTGHIGYGEIAPIPWFGTETLAQALTFCQSLDSPKSDFWRNRTTLTEADIPQNLPATQFGLASAWANLQFSRTSPPPPLSPSPCLPLCTLLPTGKAALTAWPHLWEQGFRTFKWKIGVADMAQECRWLEDLITQLPPQACLRLDANGGLTLPEATQLLELCDQVNQVGPHPKSLSPLERDFEEDSGPPLLPGRGAGGEGSVDPPHPKSLSRGERDFEKIDFRPPSPLGRGAGGEGQPGGEGQIECLEQPLPPDQFLQMQHLAQQFHTPLALDESVATLAQLEEHHQRGWTGLWVVKPVIAGWPDRLRHFWRQHSPSIIFSSVFETPIGRQAALTLAQEYAQEVPHPLALGFGTLGWFADDWDSLAPDQLWDRLSQSSPL